MLVGLSYSRCLKDIVDGAVDLQDVLVLITRTNFDPNVSSDWAEVWAGYRDRYGTSRSEWIDHPAEDQAIFREISINLYNSGRMHQPRRFGVNLQRMHGQIWLETVLPSSELASNPAAKDAWDQFQTVAGLTGLTLDNKYM